MSHFFLDDFFNQGIATGGGVVKKERVCGM